jgi:ABC-type multidrug transport system fused ATPase/permease subunit
VSEKGSSNSFIASIRSINNLLSPTQKKQAFFIILLILANSFMDVIGLASALPIINLAFNTSLIHVNYYLQSFYTYGGFASDNNFLNFAFLLLLLIFVIKNIIGIIITHIQVKYCFNISLDLSRRLMRGYFSKDFQFFKDNNDGVIAYNIYATPGYFSQNIMLPSITFITEGLVSLIICLAVAVFYAKIFFLLLLSIAPTVFLSYLFIKKRSRKIEEDTKTLTPLIVKDVLQAIQGFIDIILANKQNYFNRKFIKKQNILNKGRVTLNDLSSIPVRIIEVAAMLTVVIIFFYSQNAPHIRESLLMIIGLFIAAAYRMMPSITRMINAVVHMRNYAYVTDILKSDISRSTSEPTTASPLEFKHTIALNDISFTYPDKAKVALSKLNLIIQKGESIGVIGQTGAGKSTLIHIILRLFREEEGSLCIDGVPITRENEDSWRILIGYVKQDIFIFDGSIAENIAIGTPPDQIDAARMERALRLSCFGPVLKNQPEGLQTHIGENGSKLSGGQKQLLAVARALYKNSSVLIFDEATSALDSETERSLTESIAQLADEGITMITISHRVGFLRHCSVIYEFSDGKIFKSYTYQELASLAKDKL